MSRIVVLSKPRSRNSSKALPRIWSRVCRAFDVSSTLRFMISFLMNELIHSRQGRWLGRFTAECLRIVILGSDQACALTADDFRERSHRAGCVAATELEFLASRPL